MTKITILKFVKINPHKMSDFTIRIIKTMRKLIYSKVLSQPTKNSRLYQVERIRLTSVHRLFLLF